MVDFSPAALQLTRLRSTIADAMRRGIIMGDLVPGQRLDEQYLANSFGVSRVPIREALAILERDGLVRSEPRRGSFVIGLTDDDIHDVYEFRRMIEDFAVRRVAATIDAEGLARLTGPVERTEEAVRHNQPERMAESDLEFHRQLMLMAGNRRALAAWDLIADLVGVFLSINSSNFRTLPTPRDPVDANRHSKLLHLIGQHEVEGAAAVMRDHLLSSETVMRESIKRIRAEKHSQAPNPGPTVDPRANRKP